MYYNKLRKTIRMFIVFIILLTTISYVVLVVTKKLVLDLYFSTDYWNYADDQYSNIKSTIGPTGHLYDMNVEAQNYNYQHIWEDGEDEFDSFDIIDRWNERRGRVKRRNNARLLLLKTLCEASQADYDDGQPKLYRQSSLGVHSTRVINLSICVAKRAGHNFIQQYVENVTSIVNQQNATALAVRHPIYRFYSTWNVLFEEDNKIGRGLLKNLTNFVPLVRLIKSDHRRMMISFKTFVREFVMEPELWFDRILSFRPQVESCSVCRKQWTSIIKLETWAEDVEVLINKEIKDSQNIVLINHATGGIGFRNVSGYNSGGA